MVIFMYTINFSEDSVNNINKSIDLLEEYLENSRIELNKMKWKIDKIYDMTMQMYILAQFGKRIGLDSKAKNLYRTQFILRKQLKELEDILGVGINTHDNSMDSLDELSERVLEYIITSYDGVVNEIKDSILNNSIGVNSCNSYEENKNIDKKFSDKSEFTIVSQENKSNNSKNNIYNNEIGYRCINDKSEDDCEGRLGLNSDADWELLEKFSGM